MAIHPELYAQAESQGSLTPQQSRAISAWTEQTTASLEDLTLSEAGPNASLPLTIPLDDPVPERRSTPRVKLVTRSSAPKETPQVPSVSFRRREPLHRDGQRRREALQKGKDGSRRRQRWENGMS